MHSNQSDKQTKKKKPQNIVWDFLWYISDNNRGALFLSYDQTKN